MVHRSRILIVDDRASDRRLLRHALEGLSPAQIGEATSGEEALETLRKERYDVVISDYVMGRLDGLAVLEAVRRDHPEACRILITGHASFEIAQTAINSAGVHAFLTKPLDPTVLASALPIAIERARSEAARSHRTRA